MQIQRVTYSYVEVPDRAGEGAKFLGKLAEAGVNLISMTAFPTASGKSQIDVVVGSGDLDAAAKKAGVKLSAKKGAFFVSGDDRPGAVAEVLRKLADAKINVTATNAACGASGFGMIVFVKQKDLDAAAKALGAS